MQHDEIIIYSMESCLYCVQLKAWLKRHSIKFIEKDIKFNANFEELVSFGHESVPLTIINSTNSKKQEQVLGFNKFKLKEILHITEN